MAANSLIMTGFNESEKGWLEASLGSVTAAIQGDTEIIFVDDCSTDNTERIVACFPAIRYLRPEIRIGTAPCRILGAQIATGDVLCFLDAHVFPEKNCFSMLFARVRKAGRLVFITPAISNSGWREGIPDLGLKRPTNFGSSLCWSAARGWFYLAVNRGRPRRGAEGRRTAAHGCGLTMSRATYETIRGWVNMPGFWGGNDAAISIKAWMCDIPIFNEPSARMVHIEKPATWHHAPVAQQGMTRIYGARAIFADAAFEDFWLPRFKRIYRWRSGWDALLERGREEQKAFELCRRRTDKEFIDTFVEHA